MDFNKLNYLIAVAELRSFSKAAEKCFISQPALTRCIKTIEDELGVKLFDRSRSPIRLTYAGEHYIAGMREILEMKAKLDQEMESIATQRRGRLAVGVATTRSATWIPRIFPSFQREYPNVDIQLIEGNTLSLERALLNGGIDLCLMATDPILTKGIAMTPIYREEMLLVVSRQAEIFRGVTLPPNQPGVLQYLPPERLTRIPFLSATPSQGTYYLAHSVFDQYNIQPAAIMELINTTVAYRMAPQSGAFALAPVTVSFEEAFYPEPIFCSISDTLPYRTAGILYREDSPLGELASALHDITVREVNLFVKTQIPTFTVRHDISFPNN